MNAPCICPACGQEVKTHGLLVSLAANRVVFNGARIKLMPQRTELLWKLSEAYPDRVRMQDIIKALWGFNCEPEWPEDVIRVQMCGLRADIRPLGLQIDVVRGKGYRLVYPEAA